MIKKKKIKNNDSLTSVEFLQQFNLKKQMCVQSQSGSTDAFSLDNKAPLTAQTFPLTRGTVFSLRFPSPHNLTSFKFFCKIRYSELLTWTCGIFSFRKAMIDVLCTKNVLLVSVCKKITPVVCPCNKFSSFHSGNPCLVSVPGKHKEVC